MRIGFGQRNKLRVVLLTTVCALAFAVVVATAVAATYQYCNGCTINGGTYRASANSKVSDLSYLHRLSGPGSSYSGVQAVRTYNGNEACFKGTFGTQVSCDPHNYDVIGAAHNGGAGNYGYNAHLRY